MMKTALKMVSVTAFTLIAQGLLPLVAVAEVPSLSDGFLCVAKGKTDGKSMWFQTSVIDDSTMKADGTPVTIRIIQSETAEQPYPSTVVGTGTTTYVGDNRYSGVTATNTPIAFVLSSDNARIALQHAGKPYAGICH